jgi:hypothetical protein
MATARPRVTRRTTTPTPAPVPVAAVPSPADDMRFQKYEMEYLDLTDITPYEYNPRDNEQAIPAVAESMKLVGFIVPAIIDDNNVLVAGHTRTEAARLLGITEVPCIRTRNLTQEVINAFRMIDNKVAEGSKWNNDLVAGEFAKLADAGIDWTQFGWTQEEVDCLSDVVASDCLDAADVAATAIAAAAGTSQRRAPQTARFVLGEVVFFLPTTEYRNWVDGIRQLHDFNEVAIVNEIKRRLGILS